MMPAASSAIHLSFALYFLIRLLTVTPFLPHPTTYPSLPFFRLLLLAVTPLLPLCIFPVNSPFPLLCSYLLTTCAALRFAINSPLLSFTDLSPRHFPRLLLWRIDILFYFLFVCITALRAPLPAFIYSLLAGAAVVITLTDLYARARQQHYSPHPLHLVSLAFQRSLRPQLPEVVPPNIRNTSASTLLSFQWVTPIVSTGRVRPLEPEDVATLDHRFSSHASGNLRFKPLWQQELDVDPPRRPSLFRALFRAFGVRLILGGLLKLINDVCIFVSPMVLRLIILHLQNRDNGSETNTHGILLALILFTTYLCQSMVFNQYFNINSTVQILLRGALINSVFEKSTRLSPLSRGLYTSGQIQNLMSTDTRTVSDVVLYIHMLWSSLEQICVALFLLVQLMGWVPTMSGVLFIMSSMPLQAVLVATTKKLREQASHKTDERVKFVSEAIKGIKLVKLYAWELSFVKKILQARANELDYLRRMSILQASNSVLIGALPTMLTIIAFAAYAATGKTLDAAVVFPAIALFNVIRPPLLFFPNTLINAARAAASLSRLSKFLTAEELKPLHEGRHAIDQEFMELNKLDLAASEASFTWDPSITISTPTLSNVSFQIPQGSLVAIVGPTGCGKSTLLAGLLGELPILSGKAGIRNNRSVSFCDQIPFIQNASVRENILFGKPFDEDQYWDTIHACSLTHDFDILPAGDLTEIGGRGVNLSGGQRARVSLARAVYARADICLLDDPLCAVDAHVGKSIFNECIVSKLQGKTRLLTTNQIHFAASSHVDMVIVVKNGTVVEAGSRTALRSNPETEFSKLVEAAGEVGDVDQPDSSVEDVQAMSVATVDPIVEQTDIQTNARQKSNDSHKEESILTKSPRKTLTNYGTLEAGQLTKRETKKKGRVQLRHYRTYLDAMGIRQWVPLLVLFAFSSQVASLSVNLWLSFWSEQNSTDNTLFNLMIFILLGVVTILVGAGSSFSLAFGSIRASILLHEKLVLSVFGAPSSFFNSTPEGRLVNRFNSDMDKVDSTLGPTLLSLLRLILSLSFTLGLILWATPGFILVVIPVAVVCLYIQEFYRRSSVDLRRLEALARSPLYSHFGETLDGVVTIRAFRDVSRASRINSLHADQLNRTSYATSYANRWIAVRLEGLGTILILGATTLAVLSPPGRISSSMTGLVLSYTMQILGSMTWCVRQFTDCESQLSSIERVSEYSEPPFPQEEEGGLTAFLQEQKLSAKVITRGKSMGLISEETVSHLNHSVSQQRSRWPRRGQIEFRNVEMRYRKDLKPALKEVTFSILPGEHVGIVGRTGAGKSSAIQSLFRLYELEKGKILIDGVDISSLRLFQLRSALGVIPQEPICFSGTIRSNLDMFGDHDDDNVQRALDSCGLQATMRQKVTLDFEIAENGANLSVGQRQLLCLGRALLKDSQILILDEATSSVSNATDEVIQTTLREEMHHCTILTVAHRLHTVMRSDRIIVMDKGRVAEIGKPSDLLSTRSRLRSLVNETGPSTAAHLRYLASLPRGESSEKRVHQAETVHHRKKGCAKKHLTTNGIDESEKDSLVDRVYKAFLELRSAVTDLKSTEWREELIENNVDETQWRQCLYNMISRLSSLADNVSPLDSQGEDMNNFAVDVADRSTDLVPVLLEGASPRSSSRVEAENDMPTGLKEKTMSRTA